jgi:hypothetical protein
MVNSLFLKASTHKANIHKDHILYHNNSTPSNTHNNNSTLKMAELPMLVSSLQPNLTKTDTLNRTALKLPNTLCL